MHASLTCSCCPFCCNKSLLLSHPCSPVYVYVCFRHYWGWEMDMVVCPEAGRPSVRVSIFLYYIRGRMFVCVYIYEYTKTNSKNVSHHTLMLYLFVCLCVCAYVYTGMAKLGQERVQPIVSVWWCCSISNPKNGIVTSLSLKQSIFKCLLMLDSLCNCPAQL
jgi:hypothetical protein